MDTSSSMAPFFLFHLGSEHCGQTFLFLLPPMVVIHNYFLCRVIEVDHVQHMFMCSVWKQHGSPVVRGATTPWTRMSVTLSVLTASGAATISTELNFQILQSLAPIVRPQPTVDYFSAWITSRSCSTSSWRMATTTPPTCCATTLPHGRAVHPWGKGRGARGAPDDESIAYIAGTFESSPPPRASGGRKHSRA
jgi:hypothetical protein